IGDFDKPLSPDYMQRPLFRKFGVDEKTFWKEANGLAEFYQRGLMHNVSRHTLYLNHILTYVERGIFQSLNNQMLFELGAEIELFESLPGFLGARPWFLPLTILAQLNWHRGGKHATTANSPGEPSSCVRIQFSIPSSTGHWISMVMSSGIQGGFGI